MDSSKTPFDDPVLPGKNDSNAGGVSSATGAFGVVSAPQSSRDEDDLLKSLMREPAPSASAEKSGVTPLPPSTASEPPSGGEFTQILKTLSSIPQQRSGPAVPAAAKQSGSLDNVFRQISIDNAAPTPTPPPATVPPATVGSPGSFTQMFSTLAEKRAESVPSTPSSAPSAAPAASSPGSFTQMFSTLSANAVDPTPATSQNSHVTPATPPASSISQPNATPSATPGAAPGSFTQMFSTLSGTEPVAKESTRAPEPLPSFEPRPLSNDNFQFSTPPLRPAEPAAAGGFTQLIQALNREAPPLKEEPAPAPLQPTSAPAPAVVAGGGFTQLLRTLSEQPASPSQPPIATEPAMVPVPPKAISSGPGEFTRVISGSALRDLQGGPANPASPVIVSAPSAGQPFQMPKAPAVPHMPAIPAVPAIAGMAMAPHAGGGAPPAAPHFAPPAFSFPQPPAPAAAAPAEPGKLQKYLPLILVLNVFVLLVIVLILFFALHHK